MARLLRHMFHNSIKKHKPQEIKDAILGSSASSGTTGENTKIVTDNIFGCFLSDRLLFLYFSLLVTNILMQHFLDLT